PPSPGRRHDRTGSDHVRRPLAVEGRCRSGTSEDRALVKKIAAILAAMLAVGLAPGAQHAVRVHRHPARRRLGPEEASLPRLGDGITAPGGTPFEGLWRLTDMPDWLQAIARPEHLKTAMERSIAEFASGALVLEHVRPRRSRLMDGVVDGVF